MVWNEERSPACWIDGVNNSLWYFSDYVYTESLHSAGDKQKQLKTSCLPRGHTNTHTHCDVSICLHIDKRAEGCTCIFTECDSSIHTNTHFTLFFLFSRVNHQTASLPRGLHLDDSSLIKWRPCRKINTLLFTHSRRY